MKKVLLLLAFTLFITSAIAQKKIKPIPVGTRDTTYNIDFEMVTLKPHFHFPGGGGPARDLN